MQKKLIVLQDGIKECGSASLLSIIRYYGGNISINRLIELTNTTKDGTNFYNLKDAAQKLGLIAKGFKIDNIDKLKNNCSPLICHLNIDGYNHFVVLYSYKKEKLLLMDPAQGRVLIDKEKFSKIWTGNVLMFYPYKKLVIFEENKLLNKILLNVISSNKPFIFFILILSVVFTITSCIITFYMQITIDKIINSSVNNLIFITIFFSIMYLLKNFTNYIREKLLIILNQKIDISMFINTYSSLLLLPYKYYKNHTTGEIISRINDLIYIRNIINQIIITVLLDLLISIVGGIILYNISKKLFVLLILLVLLYVLVLLIFKPLIKRYTKIVQGNTAKINSFLVETINSFETIKGISIENNMRNNFEQLYLNSSNMVVKYNNIIALEKLFNNLLISIFIILIMYYGTKYVSNNILPLSSFITFNSLLIYFIDPIRNIIDLNKEYNYAINSFNRINNLFNVSLIDINTKDDLNLNGSIIINNLTFSIIKDNIILKDVKFNIFNGEKVLIMGPSGSGKSTILKILMKYYEIERNKIFINNIDLCDIKKKTIKKNFSYVSQNEYLYTMSLKDNIILNRDISEKDFLRVCNITQVNEIIQNRYGSYDILIEENGFNLSGGQRQRIILARTLLKNSKVLFIDEGMNQIDVNLERKILKNIFLEYHNKTIVIVSHRIENMDLYDKVIKFKEGNIVDVITKIESDEHEQFL